MRALRLSAVTVLSNLCLLELLTQWRSRRQSLRLPSMGGNRGTVAITGQPTGHGSVNSVAGGTAEHPVGKSDGRSQIARSALREPEKVHSWLPVRSVVGGA